jgi:RNA polymerase sigma-70 factor (ECF subfamily)
MFVASEGSSISPRLFDIPVVEASDTLASADAFALSQARCGDEAAMARLYDAYSRIVYSVALRVLKDPGAAEDVLQDVFLKIWRNPISFLAAKGSLGGWLAIISRNRAIDVLRKRRSIDDVELWASNDVAGEVERGVMIERAKNCICKLPNVQREALEMAFFGGLTHAEISEQLGTPLGTIKTRIRSALQTLGNSLRN